MKVLIVNTSDHQGGAARAAFRLHEALLSNHINSHMIVQNKSIDDTSVIGPNTKIQNYFSKIRPIIDRLPIKLYPSRSKTLFSPSWFGFSDIVKKINNLKPDVVHLHWICGGMIPIDDIKRIKAPIIWSLHDMWAFTGGCHYSDGCEEYKKKCGSCKVLRSKSKSDLSYKQYKKKKNIYSSIKKLTIVGLSSWLNELSSSSPLLKNKVHHNLPNCIDTKIYKPFDKDKARLLWNLPKNKNLILFGAMQATSDPRKGFSELIKALKKVKLKEIELVIFGSKKPNNLPDLNFKTHYLGNLNDDISLVTLYSAVDLMIMPSLQENLSNTVMECLACGTPVIAFDIGGNKDMIVHKKNGYLAKPFDINDLAKGVLWVINNPKYDQLCSYSHTRVKAEFDMSVIVKKYIKLYDQVIHSN